MREVQCGPTGSQLPADVLPRLLVQIGPTLAVRIGFDAQYRPDGGVLPAIPDTPYLALVDTGASQSCIDSELAATLDLPVVDRKLVSGVHGILEVNIHLAQIYVPGLFHVEFGKFAGVHLKAGGQPHLALIGRNFLRSFSMIYDGETGSVIIRKATTR